jgi:hypothetical protein
MDECAAFIIGCLDGNILVSSERLKSLFEVMPTLRFLLFGHPLIGNDASTQQVEDIQTDLRTLKINDEFNISRDSFNRIMTCALSINDLPNVKEERKKLLEDVNALGGCLSLEERVRQLNVAEQEKFALEQVEQRRALAITPAADVWNMFEWRNVGPQYCYTGINQSQELLAQGFEYVGHVNCGDNGSGVMAVMHYFRRIR